MENSLIDGYTASLINQFALCNSCETNAFVCPYRVPLGNGATCPHHKLKTSPKSKSTCEWKTVYYGYEKQDFLSNPHNDKKFQKSSLDYKFCPYCGKPLFLI